MLRAANDAGGCLTTTQTAVCTSSTKIGCRRGDGSNSLYSVVVAMNISIINRVQQLLTAVVVEY